MMKAVWGCYGRMKNLEIYLRVLRAANHKQGITIPELRSIYPSLRDLTNERIYCGFVRSCMQYGWLRRRKWHMRKLGGHEFVFRGNIGYVEHGTDFSKQDGRGQAGTIYDITAKGKKLLQSRVVSKK
jgi:hypothetical protein